MSSRAEEPDSARPKIVVSVPLYECISQFRLGAADSDDILEGVSPFLVCPQHYHRANGTRLDCNTYGLLTSQSGSTTITDLRTLSEPKLQSPGDALELSAFVGGYSCLIDCLLGTDHGAAMRLRQHADFWRENAITLTNMLERDQLAGFLMRIMRTLQLITISYINRALEVGTAAALPNYSRIEDAVNDRTWQNLSQLPTRYLDIKPAPVATMATTANTAPASVTSSATAPTASPRLSVRVDAPKNHQHPDWATKFAESAKEIKELKLDATRPKVCLSYHLRGTCFESCREHSTHRALTATEKSAVQAFLDKAL